MSRAAVSGRDVRLVSGERPKPYGARPLVRLLVTTGIAAVRSLGPDGAEDEVDALVGVCDHLGEPVSGNRESASVLASHIVRGPSACSRAWSVAKRRAAPTFRAVLVTASTPG